MRNLQSVESMLVIPEKSMVGSQSMVGIKPIVSAVAVAMFSMGVAQVQAGGLPTCVSISDSQIVTHRVTGNCTVTSGGAIDVIGAEAIKVNTSNETSTSVTNAGRITGTTGIYVEDTSSGYTTTVNNTGTIVGSAYSVNRAVGGFTQNVSISNNTGGQIVGGIKATNLLNEGSVTLKSNVDLSDIRNSGGSASAVLSGHFSGESGSTLRIAIVSPSDYSHLEATSANVTGSTLDVDVKASSGIANGQAFYVVRAPNMTSSFTEVTDNSAMFNFTQRLVKDQVSDVGEGLYIDSVRVLSAFDASGKNAGSVLDSGASGLDDVVSALGMLATEQEVSDAVTQTLPLFTGGMSQATSNALHGSSRVIQARQEGQYGHSSGDALIDDKHAWVKPFGSWANQDDRKGVSGYEADTYGIVLGVDAEVSDTNRLGMAFAYANSNVDSNSSIAPQSADVNSYQLVVYGSQSLSESTDINFQADIGMHDNEGLRQITFMNTTAKSDYTSWSAHVGAGLSHTYALSEQTTLTPSVRGDYTRIRDESYTETGAGALNLNVNSNVSEELILGLNGKLVHVFTNQLSFAGNLGVGYDVMNDNTSITSAFAGAPSASFVTQGLDSSPWLLRGGVGIVNKVTETLEISANYDFETRKRFDNQTASVKLRWVF